MFDLVKVLSYAVAAFGLCEILVFFDGPFDLVEKFRRLCHRISPSFGKLFTCMACLSTWVGLMLSALDYCFVPVAFTPFNMILGQTGQWWLTVFLDGMFTCGAVWTLYQLEEMMERTGKITYEDEEG